MRNRGGRAAARGVMAPRGRARWQARRDERAGFNLKKARTPAGGRRAARAGLFAGCGGLSLGFHAAGFEIAAAVEFDSDAAASHGLNFHPGDSRHAQARDITKLSPEALCAELDLGEVSVAVDVIVGGPPCQGYGYGEGIVQTTNALARRRKSK